LQSGFSASFSTSDRVERRKEALENLSGLGAIAR
jgi:hypothetical protein